MPGIGAEVMHTNNTHSHEVQGHIGSSANFKVLKTICVPLLGNSLLTPETIPLASNLLAQLVEQLKSIQASNTELSPATIDYVFFPILHIFRRNPMATMPDFIIEKLMGATDALFNDWWWSCDVEVWEQMLMLCSAVLSGISSGVDSKGKRPERDEGVKRAAVQALCTMLRRRAGNVMSSRGHTPSLAEERYKMFKICSQLPRLLPILGQTLTALMDTCLSHNRVLQDTSLQLMQILISAYFPEGFLPSILPGVTSAVVKVAVGKRESRGWASSDTVSEALSVMQSIIVGAISDEVCQKEGALRVVTKLEDLTYAHEANSQQVAINIAPTSSTPSFFTSRTSVWLSASASQLHIALNTLGTLLEHPNPTALLSVANFSRSLLYATSQTLADSQSLLLSFLLSLSASSFPDVSERAHGHLLELLTPPSKGRFTLLTSLSHIIRDNLNSLSRLLPSHNDKGIEHLARQVTAACKLSDSVDTVSDGIGSLLGPAGGIEKWGWNLISVLRFIIPPLFVSPIRPTDALLEDGHGSANFYSFPEISIVHVSSKNTRDALDDMFHALGRAAGRNALFSIEWFLQVGRDGKTCKEVSALWCSLKLFEGSVGVSLNDMEPAPLTVPRSFEKVARHISNTIADLWDYEDEQTQSFRPPENTTVDNPDSDKVLPLEYVKGLVPLVLPFDSNKNKAHKSEAVEEAQLLHIVLSLQLLSISAAVLRARFVRELLHTLYPILQSLVSEISYVSATGLASLHYITSAMGYASPSNLLLANFDYALDGVSRHLDRKLLDPEATRVLVILVRLIGKDIVSRAGDVVEACFDRLDEFHGYTILVEGFINVLTEVVKVVEMDYKSASDTVKSEGEQASSDNPMQSFFKWYQEKREFTKTLDEDYGPAPREDWTKLSKGKEKEAEDNGNAKGFQPTQDDEIPLTPSQNLTKQIISHSIYFLTHGSPPIRMQILDLLGSAGPILTESALLPTIHEAWPYILNRLDDPESYVITAAASLVESLCENLGEFLASRVCKDVWPRFQKLLSNLEKADSQSALARRGLGAVGTKSAYSQSHRLYRSLIRTMKSAAKGAPLRQDTLWEVTTAFRRFLHSQAHPELQKCARELYETLSLENNDVVWLVLSGTMGKDAFSESELDVAPIRFLREPQWDIKDNAQLILRTENRTM